MSLILCRGCHRHIKRTEGRCPFCETANRSRRVERAATAVAIVVGLGVAGCGSTDRPQPLLDSGPIATDSSRTDSGMDPTDSGMDPTDSGMTMDGGEMLDGGPVALYGPVPVDAGVMDAGMDGAPVALYGPAPVDAGQDADRDSGTMIVPLYGPPPA